MVLVARLSYRPYRFKLAEKERNIFPLISKYVFKDPNSGVQK